MMLRLEDNNGFFHLSTEEDFENVKKQIEELGDYIVDVEEIPDEKEQEQRYE